MWITQQQDRSALTGDHAKTYTQVVLKEVLHVTVC
jgi:hypothetical protein